MRNLTKIKGFFSIVEKYLEANPKAQKAIQILALITIIFCGGSLLLSEYEFINSFTEKQKDLLNILGSNATTVFLSSLINPKKHQQNEEL